MARYTDAIEWLALYEDHGWLKYEPATLSNAAQLVADVFGKSRHEVTQDVRRAVGGPITEMDRSDWLRRAVRFVETTGV